MKDRDIRSLILELEATYQTGLEKTKSEDSLANTRIYLFSLMVGLALGMDNPSRLTDMVKALKDEDTVY